MLLFRPNEFVKPSSLQEVISILNDLGSKARIIAGGTGFYELAQRNMIPEVKTIVSVNNIGLNYVKADSKMLRIGAVSNLADLLNQHVLHQPGLEALEEAVLHVKPDQVKNVATIGGALCLSLPFLDIPVALCALEAEAKVLGPGGERSIAIHEFFLDYFLTDLGRGEMLVEVLVPRQPKTGSAFLKLGRTAHDFGLVTVAVRIKLNEDGTCSLVSIFLGSIGRTPIRAHKAEKILIGRRIDDEVVREACESLSDLKPTPYIHGSPEYKRKISKVLLRDAVKIAAERAAKEGI